MKQFNLEKALAGEPVVTRGGEKVSKLVYLPEAYDEDYKVFAVIDGVIETYNEKGEYNITGYDTKYDLLMASKKRTVWVTLYESGEAYWDSSEEEAEQQYKDRHPRLTHRLGNKSYQIEIEE